MRGRRGWSQDDLAARVGRTKPLISSIERNRSTPSAYLLTDLRRLFGVSVDWILFGEKS